ncbi:MlaE family ABC transporter permease [Hydrogenophaga sp. MI9]|uniref:MlaE family ABC transporter permease n=1 Tax=Hydrogenophaga sp. MI9 TaxID=3453719 RepID=UPI003EE89229
MSGSPFASTALDRSLGAWSRRIRASWAAWWHVLLLGAQVMVLALVPSSYAQGAQRSAVLRQIYTASAPLLTWFLTLSALLSLVLIRIVVATAYSYGLSQYALEVLVRTLVLELIPLYAAMFVALRHTMPEAQRIRRLLAQQHRNGVKHDEQTLLRSELLPRALAGVFSVLLLAAVSCVIALVLTYLNVYGFSHWGLPAYTRAVGQVFTPAVTLIFGLKTLFFSLAVAIVPLAASARRDLMGGYGRLSDITEFARLLSVLLIVEVVSLLGNYY